MVTWRSSAMTESRAQKSNRRAPMRPRLPAAPRHPATPSRPARARRHSPSRPARSHRWTRTQLEQFRQFQQFQDYLRFAQTQQGNQPAPPPNAGWFKRPPSEPAAQQGGAQPPMIPPGYQLVPAERRRAPRWLSWLGKKVIAWVLAIVILGVAGTWLYNHFFPSDAGKTSAQLAQEGGGKYQTNHILSTSPYEAVRLVYDDIAQNRVVTPAGRVQSEWTAHPAEVRPGPRATFRQNTARPSQEGHRVPRHRRSPTRTTTPSRCPRASRSPTRVTRSRSVRASSASRAAPRSARSPWRRSKRAVADRRSRHRPNEPSALPPRRAPTS